MAKATKPPAKKPAPKKPPAKKKAAKRGKNAKPERVDWSSPEMLAVYDRETGRVSAQKAAEIDVAKREWDRLKEEANLAKKNHDKLTRELKEWDAERELNRGKPPTLTGNLFGDAELTEREKEIRRMAVELERENQLLKERLDQEAKNRAKVKEVVGGVAAATVLPNDKAATGAADGWFPENLYLRFPLAEFKQFGLTDNDIKILADGTRKENLTARPITTLGDVNEYTKPLSGGYSPRLTDFKGFGKASLDRWDDAHAKFWAWWGNKGAEQFAEKSGFKRPVAADVLDEPPATIPFPGKDDGKELRGGGAKPAAEPKPKKAAKGEGKRNAKPAARRVEADRASGEDGKAGEPGGVDEHGFPASYADPEPAEESRQVGEEPEPDGGG